MKYRSIREICLTAVCLFGGAVIAQEVRADGTETLGPPSIAIESGTGIVAAGTGLAESQPGTISIDVPGAPVQVIAYWECFGATAAGALDDEILIDGIAVTGTLIGGPTFFFNPAFSAVHRADITGSGLVGSGLNTLDVEGLDCTATSNGAGILVIFDDGVSPAANIDLRDGDDLAFGGFPPPLDTTVPQTFTFPATSGDRTASMAMFFSSVAGAASTGGLQRPHDIQVIVDGPAIAPQTTSFIDVLGSNDGEEWDTFSPSVSIPAGADTLTVQAFSRDLNGIGLLPASFTWAAAGLSVPAGPNIELVKQVSLTGGEPFFDADNPGDADVPTGSTGADATYRMIVRNTGSETLIDAVINDPTLGILDVPVPGGPLLPGDERVIDAGDAGFSLLVFEDRCDGIELGNKSNIATVSAVGEVNGEPVSDEDPANVNCIDGPSIELLKQVSLTGGEPFFDADNPADPDVPSGALGDDATYRLVVRNTGDETLIDAVVSDPTLGLFDVPVPGGPLFPGDERVIDFGDIGFDALFFEDRCDSIGNVVNLASVNAVGEITGQPASDENPANVNCADPQIELLKQVSLTGGEPFFDADNPGDADVPTGATGADATYRLIVRNIGSETLIDAVVSDATLGLINVAVPGGPLLPGDIRVIDAGDIGFSALLFEDRCDGIDLGNKSNIASVNAMGEATGQPVSSENPANVNCIEGPAIELLKQVSLTGGEPFFDADTPEDAVVGSLGDDATYRLIVRNIGDETLVGAVISDPTLGLIDVLVPGGDLLPGDERVIDAGDAGFENLVFENRCDSTGTKVNIARVDADGSVTGQSVSDEDPANVNCEQAAACVVIIDEDGVDNNMFSVERAAQFCGVPNDQLVNDQSHFGGPSVPTEVGNPPLFWNERVAQNQCGAPDGPGRLVLMPTGEVDDEGWFALPRPGPNGKVLYSDSSNDPNLSIDEWVSRFVAGTLPQKNLDKVRDVAPLRNQDLVQLVGKTCVAVVYDSDISSNTEPLDANLQGERYGLFTFKVEAVEVVGPDSVLPETRSDTSLYALWLRVLPPEQPGAPFAAKIHDHEPDSIQTLRARYSRNRDRLTVYGESNFAGTDNTPPYTNMVPNDDGDDISYMTLSVDGPDGGNDPNVEPFILEAPMTFNRNRNRYEFRLDNVGVNLDGRRLSIQTDEGGAYNVIID